MFHLILDYLLTCIHLCESLFVFQPIFLPCHVRLITLLLRWVGRLVPFKPGLTTPVGWLVTLTDRPKSVRNRCVIDVIGGVCVFSIGFRIFCWYRGFCHMTGSDLLLFLFFIKHCTLTNKAVGTIWRDLSKPPQRRQGPDPRPLWLLVGTP